MAHILRRLTLAPQYAIKYGAKDGGHAQRARIMPQPGEVQSDLNAKIGGDVI